MSDRDKTRAQLIAEVQELRQRMAELEAAGTQEALRRQQVIFETIVRNAPILAVWLEPDGRPGWVNPAWERTLGWSLEEARGLDVFALAYPDPDTRRDLFGFVQTAQGGWGEFETRRRDGALLHIVWTGIRFADGATLALGRDISAQKRLEQALRTSETKYRTLFEAASDGIFLMKADRFVDCNRRALEILGATRQQLIGRTPADFSPPRQSDGRLSWEKASEKIQASLGGAPQRFEWKHRRRDGSLVDAEVSLNKISLADGVYLQAIVRDITERQQAEQALRQSEERYRILFEDSPISLWEEDLSDTKRYLDQLRASGIDDLRGYLEDHPDTVATCIAKTRVLDVNKATVALFRASSKQDLLGDLRRVAGQQVEPALIESVLAIARGETAFEWEAPSYTLAGDRLDVEIRWSVVPGYEESFARVLLSIVDITGRKQAEGALRRYAERVKAMHMFDHGVLAAESPQAVAHMALGYLRDLIPCVRASVSVFDWQTGQASSLASHGTTELDRAAGYSLEMFGDTQQLGEGRVHLVEDMQALPRPLPHAAQVLYDFGVRSYMNVPLIVHGELIGCLNLGSGSPGSYLPEHVEIAREVADSLAIVIQNARLFDEVQAGRQRLQLLSHRLLEVQENERRHIARELHDEVGQTLTGLKLLLEMSSRLPADGIQCNLDEALGLVNQLAERVDELSLDLRPGMLDDLGLLPALLWHFEHYSKQTGVQVRFEHAGFESRRFEPDVETAAYRIVQEALTNVARHASVGQVEVRCMVARHMLSLQIRDEGAGFDPQAALASATSSGLSGIRERVALLEGQLTIDSAPHTGTRLTVELPLDGAE